jgi:BirA family transcriptional regulator, biotin operon repressor / biotin---[acetyl-CoA-carboxylase] ligase
MIITLDKIDSTNRHALREFANFADNTLIIAHSQNAGRGRRGKSWFSPAGVNIYASYIIREPLFPIHTSLWICGLAALKTLRETAPAIHLWLKWPNDVYCTPKGTPDCKLKIAGLLAETFSPEGSNKIEGVVAGLGINLNMSTEDLKKIDRPATSLLAETGSKTDIAKFADFLLKNLISFRTLAETDTNNLFGQWVAENKLMDSAITLKQDDGTVINGNVRGFSRRGELILNSSEGKLHKIMTGELIKF